MLAELHIPWLVDGSLPQMNWHEPDTLATPARGADALAAASQAGRWLVTTDGLLLNDAMADGAPVVVLSGGPCTAEGLARNLRYVEFCLAHVGHMARPGQRFIVEMDRRMYRLLPEGRAEELALWKQPSVQGVLALAAPA